MSKLRNPVNFRESDRRTFEPFMNVLDNYSLKRLNTFGLDVKAKRFCRVSTEADIQEIILASGTRDDEKFVLGGGSNILFTHDLNALCLYNSIKGISWVREDDDSVWVTCGSGEIWHEIVMAAVEKNLGGIENLSLIPGSAGAAPIQNIGAYGVELKETFQELKAIHLRSGEKKTFTAEDCQFGYRDSIFKRDSKGQYIITSVTLKLSKKPKFNTSYGAIEQELKSMNVSSLTVANISQAVINIRRSKLPDPAEIGNCGSFFKNPEVLPEQFDELKMKFPGMVGYPTSHGLVKLAAGWMIEQCGWKGKRIGAVGMHAKQALVLVNYGNATGSQLFEHALKVQQSVKEKFDVALEMEVNVR